MSKADDYRKRIAELEKAKRDADKLRQEAITELLAQRREINRELRALGYEPGTESGHETGSHVGPPPDSTVRVLELLERQPRRERAGRHCGVCGVDGHDGRSHKGQDPKRPFTDAELAELGLPTRMNSA